MWMNEAGCQSAKIYWAVGSEYGQFEVVIDASHLNVHTSN